MPLPRAVLPAIAVAVGVCVAVALVWSATSSPPANLCGISRGSGGQTPLGSVLALGVPEEATAGPNHWYNASIVSAQANLALENLETQIQTPSGSTVAPNALWNLTAVTTAEVPVGAYVFTGATAGEWSYGQHQVLYNDLRLDLLANPEDLSQDQWVVYLVGSDVNGCPASGSISVGIP